MRIHFRSSRRQSAIHCHYQRTYYSQTRGQVVQVLAMAGGGLLPKENFGIHRSLVVT
jgi:hypothetical protein